MLAYCPVGQLSLDGLGGLSSHQKKGVQFQPSGDAAGPEVPDSLAHSRDHWFPCTEAIVLQRRNGVLTQGSLQHSRGDSRRLPEASLGSCCSVALFCSGQVPRSVHIHGVEKQTQPPEGRSSPQKNQILCGFVHEAKELGFL